MITLFLSLMVFVATSTLIALVIGWRAVDTMDAHDAPSVYLSDLKRSFVRANDLEWEIREKLNEDDLDKYQRKLLELAQSDIRSKKEEFRLKIAQSELDSITRTVKELS